MPKIISKRCELVKLCHINCRRPAFLKHSVVLVFRGTAVNAKPGRPGPPVQPRV